MNYIHELLKRFTIAEPVWHVGYDATMSENIWLKMK